MLLKNNFSDFIVKEISIDFKAGDYLIFKLTKIDYNTVSALQLIADFLGCRLKNIGFAGNKDRRAVTEQFISIKGYTKERVLSFNHSSASLEFVGNHNRAIHLGDLKGNRFEIVARECNFIPSGFSRFINYFGEQRFSDCNADIGKCILKKDFKTACELIINSNFRKKEIENCLITHPNDFVGALSRIPVKMLSLFINAFQSRMWNRIVSRIVDDSGKSAGKINISDEELNISSCDSFGELPLIGFESEYEDGKYVDLIESELLRENISTRDFIVPQLSHLSAGGGFRDISIEVHDLDIEKIDDQTYKLCFTLPPGSYATVFIASLFVGK